VPRRRVLILCTGNSARSQMAEGLLRHLAGGRLDVCSAGTKPTQIRPEAVAVMQELGVDITGQRSKSVDEFRNHAFDYVITVCGKANESCPVFPAGTRRVHWPFADPAAAQGVEEERTKVFRKVRNEIQTRLKDFLVEEKLAEEEGFLRPERYEST
jgi:arsenate reductase (thioredoxin)